MKAVRLALALVLAATTASGALYVDTDVESSGDGSAEHPYKTLQAAIDASAAGGTIYARGSSHLISGKADAITVDKEGLKVLPWGNARLAYEISKDYGTSTTRPINISAAKVLFSGVDVVYHSGTSSSGNNWIVLVSAQYVTIDDCSFTLPDTSKPGYNSCQNVIKTSSYNSAGFLTVSRTGFFGTHGFRCDTHHFPICVSKGNTIVSCVFSNVFYVVNCTANQKYENFTFISNRVYETSSNYNQDWGKIVGFFPSAYDGMGDAEVANNLFYNDNGFEHFGVLACGRNDGFNKPVVFHHNTLVGCDHVVYVKENQGAGQFLFTSVDNVFNGKSFVYENSDSASAVSVFKSGSVIHNDALLMSEGFATGTATEKATYNIDAVMTRDNVNYLTTAPKYITTVWEGDGEDYYRLRQSENPWVINAYVGEDPTAPEFSDYVGWKAPPMGGFAIRLR